MMKTKICSLFLVLIVGISAHGDTVTDLIEKGCPSPDRQWQAKDYSAFYELLEKRTLSLPRLNDEAGRAIISRLENVENLSFHHNHNLPLEARISDLLTLMDKSKSILARYLNAANSGEKVEKEVAHMIVFELAVASTAIELVDEFTPTIRKDEKYEIRMAGLAKMKNGLTTVLDGAITSLSERTFYSDESIAKMAVGIRDYYPRFRSMLPETAKAEFRFRVASMLAKEKNSQLKQQLLLLNQTLKTEPASVVNHQQPSNSKTNQATSATHSAR
jgi:hypothetical protein